MVRNHEITNQSLDFCSKLSDVSLAGPAIYLLQLTFGGDRIATAK